jgi:hypothetical protein
MTIKPITNIVKPPIIMMNNGFEWGWRVVPAMRLASELYEGGGLAGGQESGFCEESGELSREYTCELVKTGKLARRPGSHHCKPIGRSNS